MGGSKKQNTSTSETRQNFYDPQILSQWQQGYSDLSNLYNSRVNSPLNLEYAPAFSSTPDAIVQNMLSKGVQDIKNQQSAADSALASQLSVAGTGNNAALLGALQRQGKLAAAGAANSLIPQALEQQRAFDVERQNILNAQNNQRLAARAQSISELAPGLSMLDLLNQLGLNTARQTATSKSSTKSKSGIFAL